MPDSRRVTNIEKRLGFKWEKGLSRSKRESCKIRIIKHLIDDIDELKQKWVGTLPSELRRRQDFEDECLELYERHAHRVWADPPADRTDYLVDASSNNWNGMYARDLYIGKHDKTLKDLFVTLIYEKCVRFHENQRQQERKAQRGRRSLDPRDDMSPLSELEEDFSTISSSDNKRDTPTLVNGSMKAKGHSSVKHCPVAPVAQMIAKPSHAFRSHCLDSVAQKRGNPELSTSHQHRPGQTDEPSDSESDYSDYQIPTPDNQNDLKESFEGSTNDQKATAMLTPKQSARLKTTTNYEATGHKRPAPGAVSGDSSAKRPKKQNPEFEVSEASNHASLPPRRMSPSATQSSPRNRQVASSVPAARLKLKLKHSSTKDPYYTASSPPQSTEDHNIGSTIEVSNMRFRGDWKDIRMQNSEDSQEEVGRQGLQCETERPPPSDMIPRFSDNAKDAFGDTSHAVPTTSRSLVSKEDFSIYDVAASPVELSQQAPGQRGRCISNEESSSTGYARSTVAVNSVTSTHGTSLPTGSLYNGCTAASSTPHGSMLPMDRETPCLPQKPQTTSADAEVVDTTHGNLSQFVAGGAVLDNPSRSNIDHHPDEATRVVSDANTSFEANAQPHSASQDDVRTTPNPCDAKVPSSSPFHAHSKHHSEEDEKAKLGIDRTYATVKVASLEIENQGCPPTTTMDTLVKDVESNPLRIIQPDVKVAGDDKIVSTHEQRLSNPLATAVGARRLILQLIASDAKQKHFVAVPFDSGIEDLCEKVQKRMNTRLDNQTIKFLWLRLPSQAADEEPYRIERDDPDTWEEFLEMAEEEVGQKVKVTAEVEL